jgi:hypothetical protein
MRYHEQRTNPERNLERQLANACGALSKRDAEHFWMTLSFHTGTRLPVDLQRKTHKIQVGSYRSS